MSFGNFLLSDDGITLTTTLTTPNLIFSTPTTKVQIQSSCDGSVPNYTNPNGQKRCYGTTCMTGVEAGFCNNIPPAPTSCAGGEPIWYQTTSISGPYNCSASPMTCNVSNTYTFDVQCGIPTLDGASTCSLGSNGYGMCSNPTGSSGNTCVYQKNWDRQPTDPPNSGTVNCLYSYNWPNYSLSNPQNGALQLVKWLKDIYNGTSASAPQGLNSSIITSNVRDGSFIYAALLEFYNSIYSYGYYANPKSQNPFLTVDFMQSANLSIYINTLINTVSIQALYPNLTFPSSLINYLTSLLTLPVPSQNGDAYYLTFRLPSIIAEYYNNLSDQNQISLLETFLNNILRDNLGSLIINNVSITPAPPSLSNPTTLNSIWIELASPSNPTTNYTTVIADNPYPNVGGIPPDYSMFAVCQVQAQVVGWSPMLIAYFSNLYPNTNFSPNVCSNITQQTSLVPAICMANAENNDFNQYMQYMTNFCSVVYNPPSFTVREKVEKTILYSNSPSCLCYNSGLLPQGQDPTTIRNAAICFDKNCTDRIRQALNLSDTTCASDCSQVCSWLSNPDPSTQPKNPKALDETRFTQLCGTECVYNKPSTFNGYVLGIGLSLTLLLSLLTFSLGMHAMWSTPTIVMAIITMVLIFVGITVFFSVDLTGSGRCGGNDNKEFNCYSKITKIKIPSSFCKATFACECESDDDCKPGCNNCQSSVCLPNTGIRPTKTIKVRKVNTTLIVIATLIALFLPIVLIYLYEDYHWPINIYIYSGFVVLISLVPLILALYTSFKPQDEVVFDGACQNS